MLNQFGGGMACQFGTRCKVHAVAQTVQKCARINISSASGIYRLDTFGRNVMQILAIENQPYSSSYNGSGGRNRLSSVEAVGGGVPIIQTQL